MKLSESKVIAKYIVRNKDPDARLHPKSLDLQLKAEIVENVAFNILYGLLMTCFYDTVKQINFIKSETKNNYQLKSIQDAARAVQVKNHENSIKQLSEFLANKQWILGDEVILQ